MNAEIVLGIGSTDIFEAISLGKSMHIRDKDKEIL